MSALPEGFYPPDYEHVPTVAELTREGLARPESVTYFDRRGETKTDTRYRVSAEGSKRIADAMKRNAERCKAWDAGRRAA